MGFDVLGVPHHVAAHTDATPIGDAICVGAYALVIGVVLVSAGFQLRNHQREEAHWGLVRRSLTEP